MLKVSAPKSKKETLKSKKKAPIAKESGKTLINFVLDKSGSMASCLTDTIGGFNTYINKLKADKNSSYSFSLTLFDTTLENRHTAVDLSKVPELNLTTYVPGGMTALYDAIGRAVSTVESDAKNHDRVLTVIMTDAQENSSREYRLSNIRDIIKRKEGEGWTFVFLGADLSAYVVGDSLGTQTANSVVYSTQNMGATFSNLASATMSYSFDSATRGLVDKDLMKRVSARALRSAGMSRRA